MTYLPLNWVLSPLENAGEWGSGGTPQRTNPLYYQNGTIPWLVIGDLTDGLVTKAATHITKAGLENSSAKLLPINTLLIAMYGSIGKLGITGIECATNQAIAYCKPDLDLALLKYLFYALMNSKNELVAKGRGGAQQNINQNILKAHKIPLAPINEQKRITQKLDSLFAQVDECQAHLDRVPEIINRFRQSVLAAATSGRLTEEWRDAHGSSMYDWDTKVGDEIFPFITSGSRGWATYYSDSGAKFIRVGNLDHYTIELDLSHIQYVNPPNGIEGERTKIAVGDILISITADVGMVGFVRKNIGEAYINQHIALARQDGNYSGEFLSYFLASLSGGQPQLLKAQRGAIKAGLTLGDIKSVIFKLPTLDEQYEIVRQIETLFALADRIGTHWSVTQDRLTQLTPSLLAKAFRGELVEQGPDDEPAHELLERIMLARKNAPKEIKRPRRRTDMTTEKAEKDNTRLGVIQALKASGKELSAQQLFQLAGYPSDAESELVEEFFVEVRDALKNQQIDKKRLNDADWFSLLEQ